jgi:hypothetical protein
VVGVPLLTELEEAGLVNDFLCEELLIGLDLTVAAILIGLNDVYFDIIGLSII